jgi:putative SOS response-associated peptidase YedK
MFTGMCGRFTQMYTWQELHALYSIHDRSPDRSNLEPRYNIAPTQEIDILLPLEGSQWMTRARWGLVPAWWKNELSDLPSTFNARAETVAEKPMFRLAFKSRRCVIPASGFYEWSGPKGARRPHYVTRADGRVMSFAGLWDRWQDPESGEQRLSATIIVGPANDWMSRIHNRMPVILEAEDVSAWLYGPRADLLAPPPEDLLQEWGVTPRVNSSRYQDADAVVGVPI